MAQRLATVYVKTCLMLSEAEMLGFTGLFQEHQVMFRVQVLEGGGQEVVLKDDGGDDVTLAFDKVAGTYICKGTCTVTGLQLTNLMRKAVSTYKGDAIVHRIFNGYTMVYHYERGSVVKILEMRDGREKPVYEYKDTVGKLERMFRTNEVEQEIRQIHGIVDRLLDLRNESYVSLHPVIDDRLKKLTHRLFVLEAF